MAAARDPFESGNHGSPNPSSKGNSSQPTHDLIRHSILATHIPTRLKNQTARQVVHFDSTGGGTF